AQLPPVERSEERVWAFDDPCWQSSAFQPVLLTQNMRSNDQEFLRILNRVRRGDRGREVLEFLESRCLDVSDDFEGTRLFPRREQTEKFNLMKLADLPGPPSQYPTVYSGPERFREQLKRFSPLPELLTL